MNDFVLHQTNGRLEVFEQRVRQAAKDPTDADAIHDLRVANRRLTQCLITFAGFFDTNQTAKVRKKLKRLMKRCGDVRDCDIALELLDTVRIGKRTKAAASLRDRRGIAEARLVKHLSQWRKRHTVDNWRQRLRSHHAVDTAFSPDLRGWIQAWFAQGRAAAKPGAAYDAMHQFRIEGKRLRYALELLQPYFGPRADAAIRQLKQLQDALGDMNDCVTALEILKDHDRPQSALRELLQEREATFRALWRRKFGKRTQQQWSSIFSATATLNHAVETSKKPAAPSPVKASVTSAA